MSLAKAYAAFSSDKPLKSFQFNRRQVGVNDILIDIIYCGVCHSDIHMVHNDWGKTRYPIVPGHEIIGRVKTTGADVTKFSEGQLVGVGCMVDSCRSCMPCTKHLEQFCEKGAVMTYGSDDAHRKGEITQGGYSTHIVVDQNFVLSVSETLDVKAVAPLLCAGITMYSPLRNWNVTPGQKVGIIGLGGLGHMGIKLSRAMGAEVVMITTSESKGKDAERLGAHDVIVSSDSGQMAKHANSFDLLLNTIPVAHDANPYMPLLKIDRTMVAVGLTPVELNSGSLIFGRKNIAGSLIGGIKETQQMLDFCAEHNIVSDVEMISIDEINEAYTRTINADVKYRFVIDMASLKS